MMVFLVNVVLVALSVARADSSRSDEEIRLVALRHARDVRSCYEHEGLRLDPRLAGTLEVELTVSPSGRVERATARPATLRGAGSIAVATCVTTVARNWRYEAGPYSREVIVYPFALARDVTDAVPTSGAAE